MAHDLEKKWRSKDVELQENADFAALLLSERVLSGLAKAGFKKPSPIQLNSIPIGRFGKDLLVQAKSGTGKTLVFTIIALEMLKRKLFRPQVLIIAPAREIATQICSVIKSVGSSFPKLTCDSFIGGMSVEGDKERAHCCQIAVGTPGRLKQLIEMGVLPTNSIRLFVLDEADQLLHNPFKMEIDEIFNSLPKDKQVIATSATFPVKMKKLVIRYLRDPYIACLGPKKLALLGIVHYAQVVQNSLMPVLSYKFKLKALETILKTLKYSQCLIFCNGLARVELLCKDIKKWGFSTTYISSAKEQVDRLKAMDRLKHFKCKVLVSSDVAARGIDAENVDLVINFELAFSTETYLHRSGRAGRYGSIGVVISIINEKELYSLGKIEVEGGFKSYKLPDPLPSDLIRNPVFGEYMIEDNSESEGKIPEEKSVTTCSDNEANTNELLLDKTTEKENTKPEKLTTDENQLTVSKIEDPKMKTENGKDQKDLEVQFFDITNSQSVPQVSLNGNKLEAVITEHQIAKSEDISSGKHNTSDTCNVPKHVPEVVKESAICKDESVEQHVGNKFEQMSSKICHQSSVDSEVSDPASEIALKEGIVLEEKLVECQQHTANNTDTNEELASIICSQKYTDINSSNDTSEIAFKRNAVCAPLINTYDKMEEITSKTENLQVTKSEGYIKATCVTKSEESPSKSNLEGENKNLLDLKSAIDSLKNIEACDEIMNNITNFKIRNPSLCGDEQEILNAMCMGNFKSCEQYLVYNMAKTSIQEFEKNKTTALSAVKNIETSDDPESNSLSDNLISSAKMEEYISDKLDYYHQVYKNYFEEHNISKIPDISNQAQNSTDKFDCPSNHEKEIKDVVKNIQNETQKPIHSDDSNSYPALGLDNNINPTISSSSSSQLNAESTELSHEKKAELNKVGFLDHFTTEENFSFEQISTCSIPDLHHHSHVNNTLVGVLNENVNSYETVPSSDLVSNSESIDSTLSSGFHEKKAQPNRKTSNVHQNGSVSDSESTSDCGNADSSLSLQETKNKVLVNDNSNSDSESSSDNSDSASFKRKGRAKKINIKIEQESVLSTSQNESSLEINGLMKKKFSEFSSKDTNEFKGPKCASTPEQKTKSLFNNPFHSDNSDSESSSDSRDSDSSSYLSRGKSQLRGRRRGNFHETYSSFDSESDSSSCDSDTFILSCERKVKVKRNSVNFCESSSNSTSESSSDSDDDADSSFPLYKETTQKKRPSHEFDPNSDSESSSDSSDSESDSLSSSSDLSSYKRGKHVKQKKFDNYSNTNNSFWKRQKGESFTSYCSCGSKAKYNSSLFLPQPNYLETTCCQYDYSHCEKMYHCGELSAMNFCNSSKHQPQHNCVMCCHNCSKKKCTRSGHGCLERIHNSKQEFSKSYCNKMHCTSHTQNCYLPSNHRCHPVTSNSICKSDVCAQWYNIYYKQMMYIQEYANMHF